MRARRAEERVAKHFEARGLSLLYHNQKIAGVEIDLIFLDDQRNIIFVEVKTLSHRGLMSYRLSKRQTDRLFAAKSFFESIYALSVEVRLAFCDVVTGDITDLVIL